MWLKYNNFYVEQIKCNIGRAREELQKLKRFRYLKKKLKIRLYKTLVLPHLTYPAAPLNMCSRTQIKMLQNVQNAGIRWISNTRGCNYEEQHENLKIEPIKDRLTRLAEGIWSRLEETENEMIQETLLMNIDTPHNWFPSSYERTFD